ncbi:hypothetical protein B0H13DRAFT_1852990 [Mycena leptocephala]|nr:hypothetical protein B0H13DRAFT_1852990 [Mycena leptocephala]
MRARAALHGGKLQNDARGQCDMMVDWRVAVECLGWRGDGCAAGGGWRPSVRSPTKLSLAMRDARKMRAQIGSRQKECGDGEEASAALGVDIGGASRLSNERKGERLEWMWKRD